MKKIILFILLTPLYNICFSQATLIKNMGIGSEIYQVNGNLIFAGDTGLSLSTLWVSDGTAEGTVSVWPGLIVMAETTIGYEVYKPIVFNNEFYFVGDSGQDLTTLGVWKSDGTKPGTVLVKAFGASMLGPDNSQLTFFCVSNDQLFFAADDGVHGVELWKTDGTNAGTVMVKDISTDTNYGAIPAFLFDYNNELYFSAYVAGSGTEIWKSDGTDTGTVILKDIIPGTVGVFDLGYGAGSMDPQFIISGDYLFFTGRQDSATVSAHLYRTDGTPGGTIILDSLNSRYDSEDPYGPFQAQVNGTLFYLGLTDSISPQYRLFKSDGTPQGTLLIPTDSSFTPESSFFAFNNKVYFDAHKNNGAEGGVGVSDGTSPGTSLPLTFNANLQVLTHTAVDFVSIGNSFFCRAEMTIPPLNNSIDFRLVQSNGTQQATVFYTGASARGFITEYNGAIYFYGTDTVTLQNGALYKVQPAVSLGLQQTQLAMGDVNIFPNPANQTFTINTSFSNGSNATLTIFNMLGAQLHTAELSALNSNITLSVSNWAAGIYFCTVQQNENMQTLKLVVQH